jgi:hypothetical protein
MIYSYLGKMGSEMSYEITKSVIFNKYVIRNKTNIHQFRFNLITNLIKEKYGN